MKQSRFREEPIIGVLGKAKACPKTADLARRYSVSEETLYNWKAKYCGLEVSEAKRPRALEGENGRLKRLLADAMLDNADLKDLLSKKVTPATKREAAAHFQTLLDVSERRAFRVIAADRTVIRNQSCGGDDEVLRETLGTLAHQRRGFGYAICISCCGETASR
jgi:putative transposase